MAIFKPILHEDLMEHLGVDLYRKRRNRVLDDGYDSQVFSFRIFITLWVLFLYSCLREIPSKPSFL